MRFEAILDAPVPHDVADDFLAKLHYVSESLVAFAFAGDDRTRVRFDLRGDASSDEIAGRIRAVAAKMSAQKRPFETRVLVDRSEPRRARDDRSARGAHGSGRDRPLRLGADAFGPKTTRLMQAFHRLVDAKAREMRATPLTFPTLIGGDVLERCSYIKSFPHSLSLVSHLREDLDGSRTLQRRPAGPGNTSTTTPSTSRPRRACSSPSVCSTGTR